MDKVLPISVNCYSYISSSTLRSLIRACWLSLTLGSKLRMTEFLKFWSLNFGTLSLYL
ncbi:hypothetical protein LDENG_00091790 [Lucifuga dentata]|nr:hypothetical protein LDENG_00091790 [Lucifuga dentata]